MAPRMVFAHLARLTAGASAGVTNRQGGMGRRCCVVPHRSFRREGTTHNVLSIPRAEHAAGFVGGTVSR